MARKEQYPERNAQIIAMRKAGLEPHQIAAEVGVTRNVVIGVTNRAGLSRPGFKLVANLRPPRGEAHVRAKLTEAQVRAIRQEPRRVGLLDDLAAQMGVSRSCVETVRYGYSWKHVE